MVSAAPHKSVPPADAQTPEPLTTPPRAHASAGSHEIHLSRHITRDSMVENMLKSFNDMHAYPEARPYRSSFRDGVFHPDGMPQGHAAKSPPSDHSVDLHADDYFPPPAVAADGRKASTGASPRTTALDNSEAAASASATPPKAAPSSWRLRGHDKKPSKSSNGSADSTSRPFRWTRSRSNSVDVSMSQPPWPPERPNLNTSILDRARPVPVEYHSFSDSPKSPTDPSRSVLPSAAQRSFATKSGPSAPSSPITSVFKHSGRKLSTTILNTAEHSGGVPADNSDDTLTQGRLPANATAASMPSKERSGFFRRVFGSASKPPSTAAAQDSVKKGPPQLPPLQVDDRPRPIQEPPEDQTPIPSSAISTATPEAKEVPSQTLNKKTSFFRRRRKTVAEKEPDLPTNQGIPSQPSLPGHTGQGSIPSTNSLQSVMRPFLNESGAAAPSAGRDVRPTVPKEQNIYSFGRRASIDDETLPIRPVRPGTASRVEAGSAAVSRPDVPRPSTSAKRPSKASVTDPFDHLSLRSNSRDLRSPVPPDTAYVSARASPMPDGAVSPKTVDLPPLADITNSPRPIKQASVDNAGSPPSSAPQAIRTGSLPTLSSNRLGHNERLVIRSSHDSPDATRPLVAGLNTRAGQDAYLIGDIAYTESPVVGSDYHSASSLPLVQVDGKDAPQSDERTPDPMDPTSADVAQAKQILDQQDGVVGQAKAAAILNEPTPTGERVRRAYMGLYDFSGLTILLALRDLCGHLALKGESQQVDRILSTFAQRWCDCNSNHGFKSADVVHTICYSMLLLNTDLHTVDVENKMSRSQFVKNTLPTVRSVADDTTSTIKASTSAGRAPIPWRDARSPSPVDGGSERPSVDLGQRGNRLSIRPSSGRPISSVGSITSPSPYDIRSMESASNLVNAPFDGSIKGWEAAIETVLKDVYASIRNERLPLYGASESRLHAQTSAQSLSVVGSNVRRTGSVLSKTPSEPHLARPQTSGHGGRWSSKNRSAARLYPPSSFTSSRTASRTSLEEAGMWSPSGSSTWSKSYYGHQTQTTMSSDSLSSRMTHQEERYQQSIGFANALSHAIIREEGVDVGDDADEANAQAAFEIEDGLELAGAPWAKEGIVKHKHHLETTDKKAKDRNWNECFAVIEKGWMRLFVFNSKSVRNAQKGKLGQKGAVVGGGNWTENAEALGAFMLRQTIANALPPPGYSKQRPYVFALSLPNGAVHLFNVGSAEIAKEFVSSANYWSARLSKEPLGGGVSNVEYGWGDAVINSALIPDNASTFSSMRSPTPTTGLRNPSIVHSPTPSHSASGSISTARPSISGSGRGSTDTTNTMTAKRMPADRINLAEWTPPQQSLMASHLNESEQLEALRRYVRGVEEDLGRHNELRGPMQLAFSPRSTNSAKAMANWERKSSYLLREIVKFRTYIDSLTHAQTQKAQIAKEREEYEAEKQRITAESKGKAVRGSLSGGASLDLPAETIEAIRLAQQRAEQEAQGS